MSGMELSSRRIDQLASGVMDLLVLSLACGSESYGYAITQELEQHGLRGVSEASVYTSLRRLEKAGLLTSRREANPNGRVRRYYRTTQRGDLQLDARLSVWKALVNVVSSVTDTPKGSR